MSKYMIPADLLIARLRAKAETYTLMADGDSRYLAGCAVALLSFADQLESELETHKLLEDGRPKA